MKRSCSVVSLQLRHNTPIWLKTADICPLTYRGFQTTDVKLRNAFNKAKEETRLDQAAENLSVDIANVFLERIKIDNYHPEVQSLSQVHFHDPSLNLIT